MPLWERIDGNYEDDMSVFLQKSAMTHRVLRENENLKFFISGFKVMKTSTVHFASVNGAQFF